MEGRLVSHNLSQTGFLLKSWLVLLQFRQIQFRQNGFAEESRFPNVAGKPTELAGVRLIDESGFVNSLFARSSKSLGGTKLI